MEYSREEIVGVISLDRGSFGGNPITASFSLDEPVYIKEKQTSKDASFQQQFREHVSQSVEVTAFRFIVFYPLGVLPYPADFHPARRRPVARMSQAILRIPPDGSAPHHQIQPDRSPACEFSQAMIAVS